MNRHATGSTPLLALLALVAAGACASGNPGAEPGPEPEPERPAELRQITAGPLPTDPYRALGLTGENKPDGLELRYRQWVPPETPAYVPRRREGLELVIADATRDGWLALYKGPIPEGWANAEYRVVLFGPGGEEVWALDPARYFRRRDHLEIQDIRYDGALYFNAACQTYARDAGGECSSLLKVDPRTGELLWRTRDRVSNDVFILEGPYVVAGYGFTAEPDSLHLISRRSGAVVSSRPLDTAHAYLEVKDGRLHVVTRERHYVFDW